MPLPSASPRSLVLVNWGWDTPNPIRATGGTPTNLMQAIPPNHAVLADACNRAPRNIRFIAVIISFPFVVLELVLASAVVLRLRRGLRSDRRAR